MSEPPRTLRGWAAVAAVVAVGMAVDELPMIFERFPNMKLNKAEDVVWSGFGFRGPLNLPVTLN